MFAARLHGILESIIFVLCITIIFYVASRLFKYITKKDIASEKVWYYVPIIGFIAYHGVIAAINHKANPSRDHTEQVVYAEQVSHSLDEPFIAPPNENLEQFPKQMNDAILSLPSGDREKVTQAINFLNFCVLFNMKEEGVDGSKLSDSDLMAKCMVKLYRFAQQNGAKMTLRKYITLAGEFKRQKPEWWKEFNSDK